MTATPQSQHDAVKSALKEQMVAAQRELEIIEQYEALMKKRTLVITETLPPPVKKTNGASPHPVEDDEFWGNPAPEKKVIGVSSPPNHASTVPVRPSAASLIRFDQLTKEAAAVQILKEFGKAMPAPAIFSAMKARGHPVKNLNALRSLLEKSAKFTKIGSLWDLAPKAHP